MAIPVETIPTADIHLQADEVGRAIVTFVITNFMNEAVDPLTAAQTLLTLVETNDP